MTPDQFSTRMVDAARHLGRPMDEEANGLLARVVEGCRAEWATSGEKHMYAIRMAVLRGVLLAKTGGAKEVTVEMMGRALGEVHMMPPGLDREAERT